MKPFVLFACIIIIIIVNSSCNLFSDNKDSSDTITVKSTDTIRLTRDSIITPPITYSIPAGFFQGMLPCNGCEGIQQTIYFETDNTYKMEELNWGAKLPAKKQSGRWEKKGDTILLNSKNTIVSRFRFKGDSLYTVYREGKMIDGAEMQQYVLIRKPSGTANDAWRLKGEQGIDFFAIGNEPFWNIEIDNERMILFKVADWEKPVIVPIEKPKTFRDSIVYLIPDSNKLRITILNEFCSDGMSDFLYEQKVQVRYKDQLYKGCGMYLTASRN
jgi:uncharacterized membrane protein